MKKYKFSREDKHHLKKIFLLKFLKIISQVHLHRVSTSDSPMKFKAESATASLNSDGKSTPLTAGSGSSSVPSVV